MTGDNRQRRFEVIGQWQGFGVLLITDETQEVDSLDVHRDGLTVGG